MRPLKRNIISTAVMTTVALPFTVLIIWSFSNRWFYPELWPRQWGLRAWDYVFGTAGYQIIAALVQSMLVALATLAGLSMSSNVVREDQRTFVSVDAKS